MQGSGLAIHGFGICLFARPFAGNPSAVSSRECERFLAISKELLTKRREWMDTRNEALQKVWPI
jgi:hypothetical protein